MSCECQFRQISVEGQGEAQQSKRCDYNNKNKDIGLNINNVNKYNYSSKNPDRIYRPSLYLTLTAETEIAESKTADKADHCTALYPCSNNLSNVPLLIFLSILFLILIVADATTSLPNCILDRKNMVLHGIGLLA